MQRLRLLPVAILALVLVLGVRIGDLWTGTGATPSLAQQAPAAAEPAAEAETGPVAAPQTEEPAAASPIEGTLPEDPTLFTQAEIDLLQKLADRRAELDKWVQELEMREGLLKAAEQRIDRKVGEMHEIQTKLQGMLRQYDKEQEDKLKSLVKIYESMKPKDAAQIFMELEMPVLLDVIERMREAKAAAILARLLPEKAKNVTSELAARRKIGAEAKAKLPASGEEPDAPLPSSGPPIPGSS